MKPLLGVSIGASAVHAVLIHGGIVRWVGQAAYADAGDLADVLARLASEPPLPASRARVVFTRDCTQLRTVMPAPPLAPDALRRHVALEASRLFRKNGAPLVTDGVALRGEGSGRLLWAGAIAEPLVEAAAAGCAQAGLKLEAVGPAADVLSHALAELPTSGEVTFPNGRGAEILSCGPQGVWRSRHVSGADPSPVTWHPALATLGDGAASVAAAYGVTQALPRLDLTPPSLGAQRRARIRRTRQRVTLAALALWLLAGGIYVARLTAAAHATRRALALDRAAVDTALALRRDLDAATATLAILHGAERCRSRRLPLLSALTRALRDSTYLVAVHVEVDGTVRLVGYAPSATRVLADLEGVPEVAAAKFEGPVTRETVSGGHDLDRFSIAGRLRAEGCS